MVRPRNAILYQYTHEQLEAYMAESHSITDLVHRLGVSYTRWTRQLVKARLDEFGLDYNSLVCSGVSKQKIDHAKKYSHDDLFREGSSPSRASLKKRFMKLDIAPYQCATCKLGPEWQGQKLVLILDHINGVNNDNRVENLRFLCPNCNAQTPTFTGKNTAFDKEKYTPSKRRSTPKPRQSKDIGLTIEELHKLAWEKPMSILAKELGMSDKGLKKRLMKAGLGTPNPGYWLKKDKLPSE
jgi:hypothetical protein